MFMNKELNWEVLNKNAWRFGPLIAAGLLLNVMAGGNGTDGKYYKDTRDPNTRLVRCSPSTPDAHQVPRVYLKNIK